jgi:hypothetical protein
MVVLALESIKAMRKIYVVIALYIFLNYIEFYNSKIS